MISEERKARYERQIEEVAVLFPFLSPSERLEWWSRLGCPLTELTKHMPR